MDGLQYVSFCSFEYSFIFNFTATGIVMHVLKREANCNVGHLRRVVIVTRHSDRVFSNIVRVPENTCCRASRTAKGPRPAQISYATWSKVYLDRGPEPLSDRVLILRRRSASSPTTAPVPRGRRYTSRHVRQVCPRLLGLNTTQP